MSSLYRRYLSLIQSWPVDLTKDGRDFGQYLRKKTATIFHQGELTSIDVNHWELRLSALERIARDVHRNNNKIIYDYSATGFDAETAKKGVSNEALAISNEITLLESIKILFSKP